MMMDQKDTLKNSSQNTFHQVGNVLKLTGVQSQRNTQISDKGSSSSLLWFRVGSGLAALQFKEKGRNSPITTIGLSQA
jgi:hypothetical protein